MASEIVETDRSSQLHQLVNMLSCGDLDSHECERIVALCEEAKRDPAATLTRHYGQDAAQVAQYDPAGVTAFIIFTELEDYFAFADTVDELYEQVIAAFATPTLPAYPYDDNDFETVSDFFQWVEAQLLQHHPKYQLIHFGQSYTHDFQVILVHRAETASILNLCETLSLDAERCE